MSKVRRRHHRVVGAACFLAARRDKRLRVSRRVQLLGAALQQHEQCDYLWPTYRLGNHANRFLNSNKSRSSYEIAEAITSMTAD
jgi:hypothetical protein